MSFLHTKKFEITGQKLSTLDKARGRLVLLKLFFGVLLALIGARVCDLTLIQGELKRDDDQIAIFEKKAQEGDDHIRGDIVDRNGVLLARSIKSASLYADPQNVENPKELAKELVKIFPDISYGETLKKLQSDKRFVWIKRNITPQEQYQVLYLGNPALSFKEDARRVYPQAELTSHIVGYTGVDGKGLSGLEAGFDRYLAKGDDVLATTLDVRIQHALRREAENAMQTFSGVAAAGMVMDVRNGEVLAAVSLPDFNPQFIAEESEGSSAKKLFNNLTLGVFEPGSTFKIFTMAAALDIRGVDISKAYDAREPIRAHGIKISDYHAEKRFLTIPEIFMHSSNVGSVKMGLDVGVNDYKNFLKDLGLFNKPDIEIPEVGAPIVPRRWSETDLMAASFGHAIAVSPFQLVSAASSIMNGGILLHPTFVKNDEESAKGQRGVRVVSEKTAYRLRQMMRLVVTEGTGSKADVPGYNVGGKTGTADKNTARGYDTNKRRSSFLAFFPVESPCYAVYIMVDEPKGTKESYGYATAGWVAAPAVRNVIQSIVSIEGMKPQDGDELAGTLSAYVKTKEQIAQEKRLASNLSQ